MRTRCPLISDESCNSISDTSPPAARLTRCRQLWLADWLTDLFHYFTRLGSGLQLASFCIFFAPKCNASASVPLLIHSPGLTLDVVGGLLLICNHIVCFVWLRLSQRPLARPCCECPLCLTAQQLALWVLRLAPPPPPPDSALPQCALISALLLLQPLQKMPSQWQLDALAVCQLCEARYRYKWSCVSSPGRRFIFGI